MAEKEGFLTWKSALKEPYAWLIVILMIGSVYWFFTHDWGSTIEELYINDIVITKVSDPSNCYYGMYNLVFDDQINAYFTNKIEAKLYKEYLVESLVDTYYED